MVATTTQKGTTWQRVQTRPICFPSPNQKQQKGAVLETFLTAGKQMPGEQVGGGGELVLAKSVKRRNSSCQGRHGGGKS